MSEVADAAYFLDKPGAFLPWLTSLWRDLRRVVADASATKEERELLHLIEYAASRHGDVLLSAADLDELDDRLDDLLGDSEVLRWKTLAMPLALSALRRERPDPAAFAASAESALGHAQVRTLEASASLLGAWMEAQRAALASIPDEVAVEAADALDAVGPSVLTSPDVPPEVAEAFAGALRAGLCTLAIARAIEEGVSVEPWLAHALVERFIAGVRAHLRLLAAVPGAAVPESVLPLTERLDLEAIAERHHRARAHAGKTFESARRRLEGGA